MEEGMTATKKSPADEQLDQIEDALIETILNCSEGTVKVHLHEILVRPIQLDDYLEVQKKTASIIIFVQ